MSQAMTPTPQDVERARRFLDWKGPGTPPTVGPSKLRLLEGPDNDRLAADALVTDGTDAEAQAKEGG